MEKVCRSCLKVDKQMKNIFEEAENRLPEMIKECTSIKVMPDDGLPDSLCTDCEEKLTAAFEFRKFFKNNDQALRAHLNMAVKEDHEDEDYYLGDMTQVDNAPADSETNDSELDDKLKFKCDKCSRSFTSPRALNSHKTKMHEAEDPDFDPELLIQKNKSYKCSHCDMKFSRQHLLLKHQREFHLEVLLQENSEIKMEVPDDEEDEDDEEFEEDELEEDEDGLKQNTKKEYPCDYCEKVLTTSLGLKIHRRKHTGKNLYECTECDKSFSKCRHMKNHLKMVHGPGAPQQDKQMGHKREMQCEFCDRKFKYKKSFTQHMSIEHGIDVDEEDLIVEPVVKRKRRQVNDVKEDSNTDSDSNDDKKPPGVYKCIVCNDEFPRSNHLARHMLIHRDIMAHKCDKCEYAFMTEPELQKHLARHADKPYGCFACTKAFSRGEHYIRHIKTHHMPAEGQALQCPICPEQHDNIENLAEHVKIHLASDKRHVCKTCGKAFNRADNLKTHIKSHKGEPQVPKLHLCIYCGKEFNNSSNMIVHMRRHTGERPYKCKQCGKGFPRSHDLKCHERTHSGEKPYLCTLCGKSFNKSNKLLRHTRVHTGERPYVCSICGRAFTQSNDLALHMRRHTGARPYACGVCPARFIQSGQLKAHQRSKGHWVETAPDLKGSYRVEPVISTGEAKPIRFRRTASGHKYEPPDFTDKPPPLLEQQQQQQQNEQPQQSSQILLKQEQHAGIDKQLTPANNVHLVQTTQGQTIHMEYTRPAQVYEEVATEETIIVMPVHSHTPTSTSTQQSTQLQTLLKQELVVIDKKLTPTANNVHLVQTTQGQTVHMEYRHAPHAQVTRVYEEYKVQPETIVVVPVHSHTPTSTTGTFQEDPIACSESSNAFSPADASYECRSYS